MDPPVVARHDCDQGSPDGRRRSTRRGRGSERGDRLQPRRPQLSRRRGVPSRASRSRRRAVGIAPGPDGRRSPEEATSPGPLPGSRAVWSGGPMLRAGGLRAGVSAFDP
jgi:hypothetical protein